jgi:hypothetical protein
MQNLEPERGASIQAEHLPPVLQQGERLGILTLHDLERGSRSREGIYQGSNNFPARLRYRCNQCCGSRIRILFHPGSRVNKISDPGSGSASKNLSILTLKIVS